MESEKKEQILKLIKKSELPTSRIAYLIKMNYYQVHDWLEELLGENKITLKEKNKIKYWKAK